MDCFSAAINLSSCSTFLPVEGKYLEGKSKVFVGNVGKSKARWDGHLSIMVLFVIAHGNIHRFYKSKK